MPCCSGGRLARRGAIRNGVDVTRSTSALQCQSCVDSVRFEEERRPFREGFGRRSQTAPTKNRAAAIDAGGPKGGNGRASAAWLTLPCANRLRARALLFCASTIAHRGTIGKKLPSFRFLKRRPTYPASAAPGLAIAMASEFVDRTAPRAVRIARNEAGWTSPVQLSNKEGRRRDLRARS